MLQAISHEHGCSVAATVLQWNIQRGVTVIPASLKRDELEENLSLMPTHGASSEKALGRLRVITFSHALR